MRVGAGASFCLVVASMFWPWTAFGTASSVPGHRLASLVLSGRIDPWVPRWVGLALFIVPLSGCIGLASLAFAGRPWRIARLVAIAASAAFSLLLLGALHRLSIDGVGRGGALAFIGTIGAAVFVSLGVEDPTK